MIGYATEGSFSYRSGGEAGIGFVSYDFVSKQSGGFIVSSDKRNSGVLVLVRNREEVAYHFAWMAVSDS